MNSTETSDSLISKLILLLEKNGNKVLRGEFKLKLTDDVLHEINILLKNISNLDSPKLHNFRNKVIFLKNFLSKTLKLKINQGSINGYKSNFLCAEIRVSGISCGAGDDNYNDNDNDNECSPSLTTSSSSSSSHVVIDLTHFPKLKYLELYKISPYNIRGYGILRSQLETIICTRCLNSINQVIGADGEREGFKSQYVWSQLRFLILQHNQLKHVDNSFVYTPWLQFLDLSFNQISCIDKSVFDPLANLKYLNLSFNFLTEVPTFNPTTSKKLELLILQHNQIPNLHGLLELKNLMCCDISDNMIVDHNELNCISHLLNLETLNLIGNPISYHASHRYLTCRYLHGNCASHKFRLNGDNLSKEEIDVIHYERYNFLTNFRPASSELSNVESGASSGKIVSGSSCVKKARIREAIINDGSNLTEPSQQIIKPESKEDLGSKTCGHLETKKKIEILRAHFGEDNWLHSQGGSFVQGLMGFSGVNSSSKVSTMEKQVPPPPPPQIEPLPPLTKATSEISIVSSDVEQLPTPCSSKENSCEKESGDGDGDRDRGGELSETNDNDDKSLVENEMKPLDNEDDISVITTAEDIEETTSEDLDETAQEVDEEKTSELEYYENHYQHKKEEESLLWLIKIVLKDKPEGESIFLAFEQRKELKEKELRTGEILTRWTVDSIQSCVQILSQPVTIQLTFDTLQKHRQQRTYIMQPSDAQAFLQAINEELESRTLSEMNQKAFRCMKCSSLFSKENSHKPRKILCPLCGSNLIIELDEIPVPSASASSPYNTRSNRS